MIVGNRGSVVGLRWQARNVALFAGAGLRLHHRAAHPLLQRADRVLEDPSSVLWNGLPLFDMTKTIEVNLLNRLGETDLEPVAGPDAHGILM